MPREGVVVEEDKESVKSSRSSESSSSSKGSKPDTEVIVRVPLNKPRPVLEELEEYEVNIPQRPRKASLTRKRRYSPMAAPRRMLEVLTETKLFIEVDPANIPPIDILYKERAESSSSESESESETEVELSQSKRSRGPVRRGKRDPLRSQKDQFETLSFESILYEKDLVEVDRMSIIERPVLDILLVVEKSSSSSESDYEELEEE